MSNRNSINWLPKYCLLNINTEPVSCVLKTDGCSISVLLLHWSRCWLAGCDGGSQSGGRRLRLLFCLRCRNIFFFFFPEAVTSTPLLSLCWSVKWNVTLAELRGQGLPLPRYIQSNIRTFPWFVSGISADSPAHGNRRANRISGRH